MYFVANKLYPDLLRDYTDCCKVKTNGINSLGLRLEDNNLYVLERGFKTP